MNRKDLMRMYWGHAIGHFTDDSEIREGAEVWYLERYCVEAL